MCMLAESEVQGDPDVITFDTLEEFLEWETARRSS